MDDSLNGRAVALYLVIWFSIYSVLWIRSTVPAWTYSVLLQGNFWLSALIACLHFQVCMCTTDLCNANDYNIHLENANRLFAESRTENNVQRNIHQTPSRNLDSASSSNWTLLTVTSLLDGASRIELNSMKSLPSSSSANFFVDNQILREGAIEREESLWQEIQEQDQSRRLPRQARTQGNI